MVDWPVNLDEYSALADESIIDDIMAVKSDCPECSDGTLIGDRLGNRALCSCTNCDFSNGYSLFELEEELENIVVYNDLDEAPTVHEVED